MGSPTTENMIALTSSSIIAVYPRLALRGDYITAESHSNGNLSTSHPSCAHDTVPRTNAAWKKPCGLYCPERVRKTQSDNGIAVYPWTPYNTSDSDISQKTVQSVLWTVEEDMFTLEPFQWTMGKCYNPRCPNFVLHDARSLIIL